MPNSPEHRQKAEHNEAFLSTIDLAAYGDWAATVAFYSAVHNAERLFAVDNFHSKNHNDRIHRIQLRHPTILAEYLALYDASLLARYQTRARFARQFPIAHVRDQLIGQCLLTIRQYVENFYAPPPL